MFEKETEEVILKRMMDKVPGDIDKREGSIIHNSLAPAALEIARMYSNLDLFLEYAFTSIDVPHTYIEKRANEVGMTRKQPTKSIRKAMVYNAENKFMDIPIGSRFSVDGVNFKTIERIDLGICKMECEKLGTVGNGPTGTLIPIDYIVGLAKAELGEIIDYGKEIESGEDLYFRFKEKEQKPTTSGNSNHYKLWALEVSGVGKCKVFSLWNGEGSVKIVIVDSDKKSPSKELITKVYNHIEESRPIGSKITVTGASEKKINIIAKVIIANGFNIGQVQQEFVKILDNYLKEIAFELSYISIAKAGNILLNTPGVLDYIDLRVNNSGSNLAIADEEIPVLGTVELGV